ncbi:uncharacterized protein LOC134824290 isoform X2 [Bolinopsis microptera]|uniref:uncharacterized protein LOC134824290 isoform X2 n=1 Tax=Bolinopsis microptera TaxID=2820187 RepID=UPI00307B0A4B
MRKRETIENFDSFLDKEFLLGRDRAADDHHVPDSHVPDPLQNMRDRLTNLSTRVRSPEQSPSSSNSGNITGLAADYNQPSCSSTPDDVDPIQRAEVGCSHYSIGSKGASL